MISARSPFTQPGSTTKIFAIASGKGGVGKSSVTANLAVALAGRGLSVGLLDADVYGHSIPRILGATNPPTMVEGMLMPPQAHGVRIMSMLPFKPGGVETPVAFRGPMLHRALEQFLSDVWWGDLDILLLDLPPGTGDIAISTAQLLPHAEIIVVTTPQLGSSDVAVRAGTLARADSPEGPRCRGEHEFLSVSALRGPLDLFGVGGGDLVASNSRRHSGPRYPSSARSPSTRDSARVGTADTLWSFLSRRLRRVSR